MLEVGVIDMEGGGLVVGDDLPEVVDDLLKVVVERVDGVGNVLALCKDDEEEEDETEDAGNALVLLMLSLMKLI